MFSAVAAETLKLSRHPSIWFLVWIFPIWVALAILAQLGVGLLPGHNLPLVPPGAEAWVRQTGSMLEAPLSGFGRILIAGFAVVVFAGEYGWNTWKLVIPVRSRVQLILAKWVAACALLILALVVADLLSLAGALLRPPLPRNLSAGLIAGAHLLMLVQSFVPLLWTLALASLIAVVTRSILPSVMISIAVVLVEPLLAPVALVASPYAPTLVGGLVKVLPFYHSANLAAAAKGSGLVLMLDHGERLALAPQTSLLALWVWTIAAGGLTLYRFARDDHN